jgi:hypothetical protein
MATAAAAAAAAKTLDTRVEQGVARQVEAELRGRCCDAAAQPAAGGTAAAGAAATDILRLWKHCREWLGM